MRYLLITLLLLITGCSLFVTTVPVIIQFDSSCDYESLITNEIRLEIENDDFILIGTDLTQVELEEIQTNECVLRTAHPSQIQTILGEIQNDLDDSRDEKIRELKLQRSLERQDVLDKDQLQNELERLHPEDDWPGGIIAPYQFYVTPNTDAIQDLAQSLDGIEEIYQESLDWIWISEEVLNGVEELWLYPEEFLTETPNYPTNPTGMIASDCEDQANALASTLIAEGYDTTEVRVVLGLVNFEGQIGGHAWVEIYEDEKWFAIDPTMGDYYDENINKLINAPSVPYNYFKYHNYPSLEIWYYYNNEYFLDISTMGGNAPPSWRFSARSWLEDDLSNFKNRIVRQQNI